MRLSLLLSIKSSERIMHNLMSYNQLAGWNNIEESTDSQEQVELVNDYFNCLIENEHDPNSKRICKEILI